MIASEASNVYIFGEQNLTRNAKNCQTVLPDRSVVIGQKLVQMPLFKNSNAIFLAIFKQCANFSNFEVPLTTTGLGFNFTLLDTIGIFLGGSLTMEGNVVVLTSMTGPEVISGFAASISY